MTMPGETIATGASSRCYECKTYPELGVYHSAAGYYIGTRCKCGPYSRESGYYADRVEAEEDLLLGTYFRP